MIEACRRALRRPMKILIADDDEIIRLPLTNALTKLGHEVSESRNGRQAWEAWKEGEFPLIISDWMMPDLDGAHKEAIR